MRAMIAGHWCPEVVATISFDGLIGLLRFVICASEIAIHQSWKKLIAFDGYNRRHSYFHFAAILMGGVTALFGREIVALNDLISWVQEGGPIRWAWVLPAAW